jgi:hypothetical protein
MEAHCGIAHPVAPGEPRDIEIMGYLASLSPGTMVAEARVELATFGL